MNTSGTQVIENTGRSGVIRTLDPHVPNVVWALLFVAAYGFSIIVPDVCSNDVPRSCAETVRTDTFKGKETSMGMVERFEEKISPEPNSGCWLWVASDIQSTGYGFFRHPLTTKAHRASYLIYKGEIPHGMCVCHKCDVRFCTIFLPCPAYLKPRGSSHGLSKLTEGDVVNIRAEHEGLRSVAQKYGLNEKTVWQIKTRRIWKHVP